MTLHVDGRAGNSGPSVSPSSRRCAPAAASLPNTASTSKDSLLGTHVEVGLALTDIGLSIQKMSSPSCVNCRRRSRCGECERLG